MMEVKSSASTTALDAISEAPEESVASGLIDVDMMSQDDEDFVYGSSGSLLAKPGTFEDEDPVSEDEDIGGSRNSLSGLKRWTTEENLSFNEMRGSRSELMETPLHDSHSNSTDSGIQSVGDSIRGSSDSMTNKSKLKLGLPTPNKSPEEEHGPKITEEPSLVDKVFGGQLETSYQCCNCKANSIHKETFTDLHLAFPEVSKDQNQGQKLTMQTLLQNSLKPETLSGENKYSCDHCTSLQDAVKSTKVLNGPDYLMITLMRFHYDRKQNRKTKVFTDIDYQLDLEVPIDNAGSKVDKYSLYAIVVHSGYSSDGGHYYTYAREPRTNPEDPEEGPWYIFNDSKVSFSSFESFKSVSKRFPRDTAYLLFYQKVSSQPDVTGAEPEVKLGLRTDLKMNVENDNVRFMREKERMKASKSSQNHGWSPKKDDNNDKGSGRGCGGGGFNEPARFVF